MFKRMCQVTKRTKKRRIIFVLSQFVAMLFYNKIRVNLSVVAAMRSPLTFFLSFESKLCMCRVTRMRSSCVQCIACIASCQLIHSHTTLHTYSLMPFAPSHGIPSKRTEKKKRKKNYIFCRRCPIFQL